MRVFCDDGSTAIKLAFFDGEQLRTSVSVNSFRFGWSVNPLNNIIYNYSIAGKRYTFDRNSDNTISTTNIEYQYSDINLIGVHHALLNSGLEPQEIELYVTLPISEFYNTDSTQNQDNITKKVANLMREVTIPNGNTFTIKSVTVVPESLPAAFPYLDPNKVNSFENTLVVDLGGTTLDCGLISGAYESFSKISGDSNIGVKIVTDATLEALKMASSNVNPSVADEIIKNRYNDELFQQLVNQKNKIPAVREAIESAIEQLAELVISHIEKYKSVNRICLTGGGAVLIENYIRDAYPNLDSDKVILLQNAQLALVESISMLYKA